MLSQQQAGQKTSSSVSDPDGLASLGIAPSHFPTEASLLEGVVRAIASADPDFLVGWDVQGPSLGMLAARAAVVFPPGHPGSAFLLAISRTPGEAARAASAAAAATGTASAAGLPPPIPPHLRPPDAFAAASVSAGLAIPGRSALNAWRVMRTELKLTSYTLPACVAAVLRVRAPQVGHETLARWWDGWGGGVGGGGGGGNRPPSTPPTPHLTRWRTVAALARRARLTLALLDALDVVGRAAEMARTYGIDAASVLTRGSQYRVEAVMARLAHVHNFLLPSRPGPPSRASPPWSACHWSWSRRAAFTPTPWRSWTSSRSTPPWSSHTTCASPPWSAGPSTWRRARPGKRARAGKGLVCHLLTPRRRPRPRPRPWVGAAAVRARAWGSAAWPSRPPPWPAPRPPPPSPSRPTASPLYRRPCGRASFPACWTTSWRRG